SGYSGRGGKELKNLTYSFYKLPLNEIREFQFQIRPYEYITFQNVALRPGGETGIHSKAPDPLSSASNIDLRLNLQKGDVFRYRTEGNTEQKGDHPSDFFQAFEYRFEILDKGSDGYLLEAKLERAEFLNEHNSEGIEERYVLTPDTDPPEIESSLGQIHFSFYRYITEHPVVYRLNTFGRITDIVNLEELQAGFKNSRTDDYFERNIDQFPVKLFVENIPLLAVCPLPQVPVNIGDEWKYEHSQNRFEYKLGLH
ncbi:MAG: hypothetical protein ACYTEU_14555, partial [Planctomycetota bacterium]